MAASLAQKLHSATHPVHGFIYFAPEAPAAYAALGHPSPGNYFAGRAAAMGPVTVELVTATFFNFCPAVVAAGVPKEWDRADALAVQLARLDVAGSVLHRDVGTVLSDVELNEAIELAERICDGVGYEGKPLAAGNRSVELPDDPLTRLWQLFTIIREWRGDAHVAVLTSAPVTAVEALILHAATGAMPVKILKATRGWPEEDWAAGVERLAARGLVNGDGTFTDAGKAYRDELEQRTDAAARPLVDAVGEDATLRLIALARPLRDGLIAAGAFNALAR